jgi:anti-sigma factor RsiW
MSCQDSQALLNAYVDGELDLVRSLEIEKHLQECKSCARAMENQQALGNALRDGSLYYRPPRELRPRVDAALRRLARSDAPRRVNWSILAMTAAALVVGFFADRLAPFGGHRGAVDVVAQEVLDSHLRSLLPGHLADVQSTDQHTVKPWFNGKLDFSPPVTDFAGQGFPLTGGRLDSLDGRAVAVLVYQRRQHVINLYLCPAPGAADSGLRESFRQGYNLIHWTRAGMNWWLASDVNAAELRDLAGLLHGATTAASTP